MKNRLFPILSALAAVIIYSCGGEAKDPKTDKTDADTLAADTTPLKIYTLPAPLQIPNAIKGFKTKYSEEFLIPTNKSDIAYNTNFQKAVNIGIYGIDMGYAMLFDQTQTSIDYFSRTARLANDLNILGAFDKQVIEDFRRNIDNRDSAIYIVLSSFNNAHMFLKKDNRKEIGLLITAGSFVEGLHLSSSIYKKEKSKEVIDLIAQQKLFLDNIVELLYAYQDQQEIKTLNEKLMDLKTVYDGVVITFKPGDKPHTNIVDKLEITEDQLAAIGTKVTAIREYLVN
ncbi:MAG: hypothetical protein AB1458_08095 [Bacteroidota bacterium]